MSISRLTSSTIIRKTKLQRTKVTVEISKPSLSVLLDQKIDDITAGLSACYGNNLRLLSNQQNISDYWVYSSNED
jgi:hypothetical protein